MLSHAAMNRSGTEAKMLFVGTRFGMCGICGADLEQTEASCCHASKVNGEKAPTGNTVHGSRYDIDAPKGVRHNSAIRIYLCCVHDNNS